MVYMLVGPQSIEILCLQYNYCILWISYIKTSQCKTRGYPLQLAKLTSRNQAPKLDAWL